MSSTPEPAEEALLYFIPFPSMECLAVGDRRTSATVAADGNVCWLCLPRFDATPIFGALLDLDKGGFWRLGPEDRVFGTQEYLPGTAVLTTVWKEADSVLELTDCMLWPEDERLAGLEPRRVLVRRLRCLSGKRSATLRMVPREDFRVPALASEVDGGYRVQTPSYDLGLWCSKPLDRLADQQGLHALFDLSEGDEIWAIMDGAAEASSWTVERASAALDQTVDYWRDWSSQLDCTGSRADRIRLSAIAVHLLTYAETGAVIAAPTTSLPERVPGTYNYDYRYCWVRDGSLSISLLAQLGDTAPVGKFLTWMAGLLRPKSMDESEMPLQSSIASTVARKFRERSARTSQAIEAASRSGSATQSAR